jgi:hypothetical protein
MWMCPERGAKLRDGSPRFCDRDDPRAESSSRGEVTAVERRPSLDLALVCTAYGTEVYMVKKEAEIRLAMSTSNV